CVSRGLERALSGLLVRGRLFLLALGNTGKSLDARQFLVGQVVCRRRANQIRLSLDEVGTFNGIEGLFLLYLGAKFYKSLDDGPLISREDLDRQIVGEINVADRFLLDGKQIPSHRFDLDRVQLAG